MRLCRLDELPDGQSKGFDPLQSGRDQLFVVRRDGQLHGWRNACPHVDGAPMAWRKDAYLNGKRDRIICAAHGAQFDIASGECLLGPCLGQRLTPVALQVDAEGDLYADLAGLPRLLP
jgi:nitrite reductase/ring-hydroxylating ferredoxin subunit